MLMNFLFVFYKTPVFYIVLIQHLNYKKYILLKIYPIPLQIPYCKSEFFYLANLFYRMI